MLQICWPAGPLAIPAGSCSSPPQPRNHQRTDERRRRHVPEHRHPSVGSKLHAMLRVRPWLGWVAGVLVAAVIAWAAAGALGSGIRAPAAAGAGGAGFFAFLVIGMMKRRERSRDSATGLMGSARFQSRRRALLRGASP